MFSRISKLFIVCITLIVVCVVQQVEAGTWTQKADMPTARDNAGSAVVDGKIYVIGGYDGQKTLHTVEEYDPTTDRWTKKADMPTMKHMFGTSVVNGIIYAIGGWAGWDTGTFLSTVEAYDPATDTWSTWDENADMPTRRCTCSVTMDGKIYVIGGVKAWVITVPTVEVYDPATDTWTKKTDMPTTRWSHTACVIDGRIYVAGGSPVPGYMKGPALATVEVYDPATDTWTQVADMPRPRFDHCAAVVDGKMYIIGGWDRETFNLYEEGKILADEMVAAWSIVYVYDPATDTWTTAAPHPFETAAPAAAVVDGKIYTMGGGRGSDFFSTVYEYDPSLSVPDSITGVSPAGKLQTTWGEVKSE